MASKDFKNLCYEISACSTVSEARKICQARGFAPPPSRLNQGSFYHSAETRFLESIKRRGGFSDCHGHADRAYTVGPMIQQYGPKVFEMPMTVKWELTKRLELKSSPDEYLKRILTYVYESVDYGITYICTNIDADLSSGTRALEAAQIARDLFERNPITDAYGKVIFRYGAHPHEGFFTNGKLDMRKVKLYEDGCKDFCGGLPSRDGRVGGIDQANWDEHIRIVVQTAKTRGLGCGIHIDQQNSVKENETRRLLELMRAYRMEGRIVGVHGVSLSRKTPEELNDLTAEMLALGFGFIVCPFAAISMKAPDEMSRTGGSIAPVFDLIRAGAAVFIGGDNRRDVYGPFNNGNIWEEIRAALETLRDYDLGTAVRWATGMPFIAKYPSMQEPEKPVIKRSIVSDPSWNNHFTCTPASWN